MNIENLNSTDVMKMEETINFLRQENPEIKSTVYSMEDKKHSGLETRMSNIEDSLNRIENIINNIFGDNILIDGKFIDIKITK